MPRSFNWSPVNGAALTAGPRKWFSLAGVILAIANAVALYLFLAPPGGSRRDLMAESEQVRNQIAIARMNAVRLQKVASKVQTGGAEGTDFATKYFLPRRLAYDAVISEVQRMAKASGLQEREAVYSEEPIEGTGDLSVLNVTANFQGTYPNLMHFLYETDRSPMLLMLDTLQAAPQQRGAEINAAIRFQSVIRDEASAGLGGQP